MQDPVSGDDRTRCLVPGLHCSLPLLLTRGAVMERNEEPVGVTTVCTGNSVSRANSGRGWTYRQRGHVSRGPERELPEGGHLPVCLPLALPLLCVTVDACSCVSLCPPHRQLRGVTALPPPVSPWSLACSQGRQMPVEWMEGPRQTCTAAAGCGPWGKRQGGRCEARPL